MGRRALVRIVIASALLGAAPARAFDFKVGNQPLRLDLTESLYASYHGDNGTPDPTDKNYGEVLNRLNAQLAWSRFLFQIRFDSGAWMHTPQLGDNNGLPGGTSGHPVCTQIITDPNPMTQAALRLKQQNTCVVQPQDPNLAHRFLNPDTVVGRGNFGKGSTVGAPLGVMAFYLEKISVAYTGRTVEASLGDTYVNIGRGLVLSIRKIDELGVDTSVTGAKVIVHEKDFSGLAIAGWSNVQNIDQAKAQYIAESNDFISALHVDYRFLDKILVGAHAMFGKPGCPTGANCADHDFGYAFKLRPGVMIDAPRLTNWMGLYAEYARSEDTDNGKSCEDRTRVDAAGNKNNSCGNALYAALNFYAGRTSLLVEGKWYDNYQPWHAANDPFTSLVYMVPPTLERVITQINNNTDILAGRVRADVRWNDKLKLFYSAELAQSHPTPNSTDVLVDMYAGAEVRWDSGRSHFFPLLDFRNERQLESRLPTLTIDPEVEERLWALEWDFAQVMPEHVSLESSGLVWFRQKGPESTPGSGDNQWREGQTYLSVRYSPNKKAATSFLLSGGYEFTTAVGEQQNKHNFFNGALLWQITPGTSVQAFVGGNRSGLKCISGVCRVFPAFEGARLEVVVRL